MPANVEESIYDRLANDTSVTTFTDDRIYPNRVPDDETPLPWVHYQITGAERIDSHLEGSGSLVKFTVELDILSNTYQETRQVHNAVVASLDQYRGGQIMMAVWDTTSFGEVAEGYAASLVFEIVGTEAAILPQSGGLPLVEVREDGLYFDGEKIGATGPAGADGADGEPGYPTPLVEGAILSNDGVSPTWTKTLNGLLGVDTNELFAGSINSGNVGVTGTVTATGNITGLNLSGTNTGDQFTSTTAGKLLGRTSASSGAAQEITLGTGLSMSGTTLNSVGSPGGSTGQVQYNSSGAFAGSAALVWDNTNSRLGINSSTPGAMLDVRPINATSKGLSVKAAASQSANLTEWQDSGGTAKTCVTPDHKLRVQGSANNSTPALYVQSGGGAGNTTEFYNGAGTKWVAIYDGDINLTNAVTLGYDRMRMVNTTSGYGANSYVWDISSGTTTGFYFTNTFGNGAGTSGSFDCKVFVDGGNFQVNNKVAANVVGTFKGAASQTGDLLQLQNSTGAVQHRFGVGTLGFFGASAASQQTGGSATATGTWGSTEQGMLNKVYSAMRTFGLLS